jgi:hypothetical protein
MSGHVKGSNDFNRYRDISLDIKKGIINQYIN